MSGCTCTTFGECVACEPQRQTERERYIAAVCPHGKTTAGAVFHSDNPAEEERVRGYFAEDRRLIEERSEAPTIETCKPCRLRSGGRR